MYIYVYIPNWTVGRLDGWTVQLTRVQLTSSKIQWASSNNLDRNLTHILQVITVYILYIYVCIAHIPFDLLKVSIRQHTSAYVSIRQHTSADRTPNQ